MATYTPQQIITHLVSMGYLSTAGTITNPMGIYQEAVKYDVPSGELARAITMAGTLISGADIRNWIMANNLAPLPADVRLGVPYIRGGTSTPVVVTTVTPAPAPAPAPSPAPSPSPGGGFTTVPDYLVQPNTDPSGNVVGDTSTKQILIFGGLGLAALLLLRRGS